MYEVGTVSREARGRTDTLPAINLRGCLFRGRSKGEEVGRMEDFRSCQWMQGATATRQVKCKYSIRYKVRYLKPNGLGIKMRQRALGYTSVCNNNNN